MTVVWVCAQCLRSGEFCRCAPPITLIHQSRIREAANLIALRRERHTLTERDKRWLATAKLRWE
jgi:hypothetical protein